MPNTGKQQFTANQSIFQLLDKDLSVPDGSGLKAELPTNIVYFSNSSSMQIFHQ